MKRSILAIVAVAALCGNAAFANAPSQDKPVTATKTTTTVKKTMPAKSASMSTSKTVHKKHVKHSQE